jgi:hypothetical protein
MHNVQRLRYDLQGMSISTYQDCHTQHRSTMGPLSETYRHYTVPVCRDIVLRSNTTPVLPGLRVVLGAL